MVARFINTNTHLGITFPNFSLAALSDHSIYPETIYAISQSKYYDRGVTGASKI